MENKEKCCCNCETQNINNSSEKCPNCDNEGKDVELITVKHLIKDAVSNEIKDVKYKICMDKECDVVYYSIEGNIKFLKNQIKVPIWYKKDANPKFACYCSEVTEEEAINAVVNKGAKTVKDINEITGSMKNSNCKEKNPLGVCCHKIIQEAIDKGLKLKEKK